METHDLQASLPTPANNDDINWAMVAHLSAFLGHIVPGFGQVLGPAIVWLFKRDTSAFVADQSREALNAQISYTIYGLLLGVIAGVMFVTIVLIPVAVLLFAGAYIAYIVIIILATVSASKGKAYRYPFIVRFVK